MVAAGVRLGTLDDLAETTLVRTLALDGSWCEPACQPYGNMSLVRAADKAEAEAEAEAQAGQGGAEPLSLPHHARALGDGSKPLPHHDHVRPRDSTMPLVLSGSFPSSPSSSLLDPHRPVESIHNLTIEALLERRGERLRVAAPGDTGEAGGGGGGGGGGGDGGGYTSQWDNARVHQELAEALARIESAPVLMFPFPHVHVEPLFGEAFYGELMREVSG